jgi:type III secretion protein N (ATPase)
MDVVVPPEQRAHAGRIRELLGRYAEVELLLRVGEYRQGSDPVADEAIAKLTRINGFLRQSGTPHSTFEETRGQMQEIAL